MSDIFISYKREEQPHARKLANALVREDWTVWWDLKLRAGDDFNDVIRQVLSESSCVIVLWSEMSLKSKYVRAEAAYAFEHDKLVPVAIENVTLPYPFNQLQTPLLNNWDGSSQSEEFRKLVEDIKAKKISNKPARKNLAAKARKIRRTAEVKKELDDPHTLDKSIENHHYAFGLCDRLIEALAPGEKNLRDVLTDCATWKNKGILYLEPELRSAFEEAYFELRDHLDSRAKNRKDDAFDLMNVVDSVRVRIEDAVGRLLKHRPSRNRK